MDQDTNRNRIEVYITEAAQKNALRIGHPQGGGACRVFDLPDDLIGRALDLGASVYRSGQVVLAPQGESMFLSRAPADAVEALNLIEAASAAEAARVAKRDAALAETVGRARAAEQSRIAEWAARPVEERIARSAGTSTWSLALCRDGAGAPSCSGTQVVAYRDAVERHAPVALDEAEAECRKRNDEVRAAERAEVAAAKAQIMALALADEGLRPAAEAGYEVVGAVWARLTAALKAVLPPAYEGLTYGPPEERAAPTPEALQVQARCAQALGEWTCPSCVKVDVGRVSRVDIHPDTDRAAYMTVVPIQIQCKALRHRATLMVACEPMPDLYRPCEACGGTGRAPVDDDGGAY